MRGGKSRASACEGDSSDGVRRKGGLMSLGFAGTGQHLHDSPINFKDMRVNPKG